MKHERRSDVIGAVSAAVGAELLVVLAVFVAAAVGFNVGALTSAIGNWMGQ